MTRRTAKVAHSIPGRVRLRLAEPLDPGEKKAIIADLKLSPEIKDVKFSGNSLIVEHNDAQDTWSLLSRWFPNIQRVSDGIDISVAKLTETPEVNKLVPIGFLGFAFYKFARDGVFMAGESAFAIAYIAFDLYWKFQQENVTRKIQKGLTHKDAGGVGEAAA